MPDPFYSVYWDAAVQEELDKIVDRAADWSREERMLLNKAHREIYERLWHHPEEGVLLSEDPKPVQPYCVMQQWPLRVYYIYHSESIVKILGFEEMAPLI
jgi:hypothetical protein